MSAIGGYFGLELKRGKEFHQDAIRLNTGRNALEYILLAGSYRKIYLPYYTCDVLLQPVKKLGVAYSFYFINEDFEPVFDPESMREGEVFLYTNYFGLKDQFIARLKGKFANLVVDNAQAFYSRPPENVDTFYSPRKFFGLPDGAYLYSNKKTGEEWDQDSSFKRFEHLLRRIDVSAEDGYPYFTQNDNSLNDLPIRRMSNLTQRMLQSIDYREVAEKRKENFEYLHRHLGDINRFNIDLTGHEVPMAYPFLTNDPELRKKLINRRIYIPQYWPNVLEWTGKDSIEHLYAQRLIPLPVDQRLDASDLDLVIELVKYG